MKSKKRYIPKGKSILYLYLKQRNASYVRKASKMTGFTISDLVDTAIDHLRQHASQ